jgi:hypothetical protein
MVLPSPSPIAARHGAAMSRILIVLSCLAAGSVASAQDALAPLKPADRARIENLVASRDNGLKLAASGNPAELRAATELLAAPSLPLEEAKLDGKWRCRSIQLGGIFPLTTNPFYECRIVREGGALFLEKITGGTRRKSRLAPLDERRLLFYGAYRAAGDPVQPYGADDYRDEVGILERIGPGRLRVELPEPRAFNSARHEVVELVRAR